MPVEQETFEQLHTHYFLCRKDIEFLMGRSWQTLKKHGITEQLPRPWWGNYKGGKEMYKASEFWEFYDRFCAGEFRVC